MDTYFFSRHAPNPRMIGDLGSPITRQFVGTITSIKRNGDFISFTEASPYSQDGKTFTYMLYKHKIPVRSIVVVDIPLLDWIRAGATLLVPKTEVKDKGTKSYCGLIRVKNTKLETDFWNGCSPYPNL